jgi:hypothetical protein
LTDFGLSKEGVLDYDSGAKSFCGLENKYLLIYIIFHIKTKINRSVAYLAPEMLKR